MVSSKLCAETINSYEKYTNNNNGMFVKNLKYSFYLWMYLKDNS